MIEDCGVSANGLARPIARYAMLQAFEEEGKMLWPRHSSLQYLSCITYSPTIMMLNDQKTYNGDKYNEKPLTNLNSHHGRTTRHECYSVSAANT